MPNALGRGFLPQVFLRQVQIRSGGWTQKREPEASGKSLLTRPFRSNSIQTVSVGTKTAVRAGPLDRFFFFLTFLQRKRDR